MAGASTFPTAGFANPTLTIVAMAVRLARHLGAGFARRDVARISDSPLKIATNRAQAPLVRVRTRKMKVPSIKRWRLTAASRSTRCSRSDFLAQVNESATRLNWIVITLAAASVLASIASIVVSVWLAHRACC